MRDAHQARPAPEILAFWIELQALVQGTLPLVADGRRSEPKLARASGAAAIGRRQPGYRSRAGMAARERMKNRCRQGLALSFHFVTVMSGGSGGMEIPGPGHHGARPEFIGEFIEEHPGLSRRRLAAQLCEAWQWKQANGALCDMVCRGLLLMLRRAGGDRAAAGAPDIAQPLCAAGVSRAGADQSDAAFRAL